MSINPFFVGVPMVYKVKLVRTVNGEEIETPDSDIKRLWCRAIRSNRGQPMENSIVSTPPDGILSPDEYDRDNLLEY